MHLADRLADLAEPLSATSPCGDSLEYDADYLALEEEALGRPEVEYGNTLSEAVAPDWKRVHAQALALASRSRDLRLAVLLTRAELNLRGVLGFAEGLALVEALLTNHWEHLHPQLDPDDDNDPQLRVNILASLCESTGLLQELRESPLVVVAALGQVSLRDIELNNGEASTAGEQHKTSAAMIEALFRQADQALLGATLAALEQAQLGSQRIEALLTERVGYANAIDLAPLSSMLRRAADVLRQRLPQPAGSPALPALAMNDLAPVATLHGEITSREDVRQALDRLCAYFATHEPGSPVPLLLQRARKLLGLNFIELLQDLAPDGLAQMAQVSGIPTDER
ncbi:type VI secretion system protein TssA [Pseudomonas sp. NPDC089554]|uniref:type VI secretion system protein TssA n=1 Tax=Pseudomonas sp. NPDC089554 TaxID=3390653 RepID=UPI003D042E2E